MEDDQCVIAHIELGKLLRLGVATQDFEDEEAKIQMLNDAAKSFQAALDLDPYDIEAVIGKANVSLDEGRPTYAINSLKEFLQSSPDEPEARGLLGRLLLNEKDYSAAEENLTAAFDMHPTLPGVAGDLAILHLSKGDNKQGIKFLRMANQLQPSDSRIMRLLAECELFGGNDARSIELLEKVVVLEPSLKRPKHFLAWLLATTPSEQLRDGERGTKIMAPVFAQFGNNSATTLEVCAACSAEQGDFDQAIGLQQKALTLVRQNKSSDQYSEQQKAGLHERLKIYQAKKPYRNENLLQLPFKRPGGHARD